MPKYLLIFKVHVTDDDDGTTLYELSKEKQVTCDADKLVDTIRDVKNDLEHKASIVATKNGAAVTSAISLTQVLPL